jgi:hypothetical protein
MLKDQQFFIVPKKNTGSFIASVACTAAWPDVTL